ncbi:MAG: thioredoxin domain-containing protein [Nitrospirae bacterium]|nr:thioredoxin domain-containing protein [Nitrospirota bacterium]
MVITGCTPGEKNDSDSSGPGSEQARYAALPGASPFDQARLSEFERRRKELGRDYHPRTKHLRTDGWAMYTNRLFLETSPYLLQHAHNPVNWFPWGDEAFELAGKLNIPVLLSIGYSTCHWCHVMEEESFEDEEIAKIMNERYIAIKVDREERPDIDAIYMSAVQAMTGGGGWPMTVWLTPDRKPFYGGTYFPPRDGDRGAEIGFLSMLKQLRKAYDEQPDKVSQSGQQLANIIKSALAPDNGSALPEAGLLKNAANYYKDRFDSTYGGLSGAPKFPRYSTDSEWLVPHFEKMLYDNALLTLAYLEGYQVTGNSEFKRVTGEILRYVKRDMTSSKGAFYSSTDADSPNPKGHREEGWFFTWTPNEIKDALDETDAKLMIEYYMVSSGGNFEGRGILHTPEPLSKIAKKFRLSESQAREKINQSLDKLYEVRLRRPAPIRDEKILTAWNGLMISAYARAGLLLNNEEYVVTAKRSAGFVLENLYKNKRLFRSYKDGRAKFNAYLDDYAFFTAALLDLYEATSEVKWLKTAIEIDQALQEHYEDKNSGGFFMTSNDHEKLLAREKPAYDGAEPSGNSVAILNLLRLQEFTTDDEYRKRAEKALKAFSGTLQSSPMALSEMLLAVDFHLDKPKEIIIVSPKGKKSDSEVLISQFRKEFLPNRIISFIEEGAELESHAQVIPLVKAKHAIKGKPTAYVCELGICELPTSDPDTFTGQISKIEDLKGAE